LERGCRANDAESCSLARLAEIITRAVDGDEWACLRGDARSCAAAAKRVAQSDTARATVFAERGCILDPARNCTLYERIRPARRHYDIDEVERECVRGVPTSCCFAAYVYQSADPANLDRAADLLARAQKLGAISNEAGCGIATVE
jgi:hypothetical protein